MISVQAEDYCQECPFFNPRADILFGNGAARCTIIRCEDREKCEWLMKRAEGNKRNPLMDVNPPRIPVKKG